MKLGIYCIFLVGLLCLSGLSRADETPVNIIATFDITGQQTISMELDGSLNNAIYSQLEKYTLQFEDSNGNVAGIASMQATFNNESFLLAFDFSMFAAVASASAFCMRIYFDTNDSGSIGVGDRAVEVNWTNSNCVVLDAHVANASLDLAYNLANDASGAYSKTTQTMELLLKTNISRPVGSLFLTVGGEVPFLIVFLVGLVNPTPYYYPDDNGDLAAFHFLNIAPDASTNSDLDFFQGIPGPTPYLVVGVGGLAITSIVFKLRRRIDQK